MEPNELSSPIESPQPTQPSTLSITIPQLLNFLYGDEEFFNERHWLVRNTDAAGHCRVVSKEFAAEVTALDPGELYTHIQEYTTTSTTFYTLWRRQEWRESNERLRLSKLSAVQRTAVHTTKMDCEHIARCVARKAFGETEHTKLFAQGLMSVATRKQYVIADFLSYIRELNNSALPHLDLVTEHLHFLTAKTSGETNTTA